MQKLTVKIKMSFGRPILRIPDHRCPIKAMCHGSGAYVRHSFKDKYYNFDSALKLCKWLQAGFCFYALLHSAVCPRIPPDRAFNFLLSVPDPVDQCQVTAITRRSLKMLAKRYVARSFLSDHNQVEVSLSSRWTNTGGALPVDTGNLAVVKQCVNQGSGKLPSGR